METPPVDSHALPHNQAALPQNQAPLPQPEGATPHARPHARPRRAERFRPLDFAKEVVRQFGRDNAPLMAAALSFYTLVAMVPIMLVAVSLLGYFMASTQAQSRVIDAVSGFMPALTSSPAMKRSVLDFLTSLITGPKVTAGVIGLLGLVWSASALFLNMEVALNALLDVMRRRSFVHARLVALGTMALLGVLLLGSVLITSALSVIKGYRIPIADFRPGDLPFVFDLLGFLIPLLLSFAMFYAIYKIVPNACIESKAAVVAAAFAAVCFEIAKHGFGWYAGHFANFNKVYGTLGILVFLVTWTLYSYMIVLLGAEIASVYSARVLGRPVVREERSEEGGQPTGAVAPSA